MRKRRRRRYICVDCRRRGLRFRCQRCRPIRRNKFVKRDVQREIEHDFDFDLDLDT